MAKRRTHEEFVAEMKVLHPDIEVIGKYSRIDRKILIRNKFGLLFMSARDLIKGNTPSIMTAVNQTEYFKAEMAEIYSDLEIIGEYSGARNPILVKDKYGEMRSVPTNMRRGKIPSIQSAVDKTSYWVNKAVEVHGNKYDYSKVEYINDSSLVTIICHKHGEFQQAPYVHVSNECGCRRCGVEKAHDKQRYSKDIFITKAKVKHGNKYNYDKVVYVNSKTKVKIYCNTHKKYFTQKPSNHLFGEGCPDCVNQLLRDKFARTLEQFKIEATKKWNGFYTYNNVEYINSDIKVMITCPVHGDFPQRPASHLKGHGCNKCVDRSLYGGYSRSEYIKTANGRDGTLYKIHCWNETESFYKIGITVTGVKLRFSGKVHMPYNYEVVSEVKGEAGEIWDLELSEKRRHRKYKYSPLISFGGETECFTKLL